MITVLHLITWLGTGGAEIMLYKLVSRSDRTRFRHVVVSLMDEGPIGARLRALDVPVYALGMKRGTPSPRAALRLLALLRQVSPDVMQTWLYHADLLGLLGGLVTRVPVVWNIRSSFHHGLDSKTVRACAWLSGLPAAIIVNSESGQAIHIQIGYHPKVWKLIPNGFDTQEYVPDVQARTAVRHELGLAADALLIGLVARFDPLKDHQTFLRAAGQLHQSLPEAHFLLVGRDVTLQNDVLRGLIAAEGVGEWVHLLGERHDIPRLTAALDVATSSSYGESFPNVIGEAMACGVPCAVTDVGASGEIVADTGKVVPPKDPTALAAAWRDLAGLSVSARAALGERARSRIQANFSLEHVVRQYEEFYERLRV